MAVAVSEHLPHPLYCVALILVKDAQGQKARKERGTLKICSHPQNGSSSEGTRSKQERVTCVIIFLLITDTQHINKNTCTHTYTASLPILTLQFSMYSSRINYTYTFPSLSYLVSLLLSTLLLPSPPFSPPLLSPSSPFLPFCLPHTTSTLSPSFPHPPPHLFV